MNTGGPVVIVWGWPFVGLMTLFVGPGDGRGLLELPDRRRAVLLGGQAGQRNAAAWSWFTGWFNFLGQVAVTAGIDFGAAFFLNAFLDLQFGFDAHALAHDPAVRPDPAAARRCSTRSASGSSRCSTTSACGGTSSACCHRRRRSPSCPTTTSRPAFVFGKFVNNTGWQSSASTSRCSACCWPSTPSPATTPPRT